MNGINVLQVNRIGFNASFKIVLAIGKDFPPIGYNTNKGINISDTCIDFDDLSQGPKCSVVDNSTEPITNESKSSVATTAIIAGILGGFVLLAVIIVAFIFLNKKLKSESRVDALQEKSLNPKKTLLPPKQSTQKMHMNKIKIIKTNIIK